MMGRIVYMKRIEKPEIIELTPEMEAAWRKKEARSFCLFLLVLFIVIIVFAIKNQGAHP